MQDLRIDAERLWTSLEALKQVGAYVDEATGLTGVNRLALSDADAEGRRLVRRWFEEAGLSVRVDQIGNTIGRREGKSTNAAIMMGSHIDSVPTGGAFDGALGVLGALEVVRSLNDASIETARPIEIAFFTDEEGARFGTDMLGSAVACGRLTLERALSLTDRDGKSVGEELARIGFRGSEEARIAPPHAYLEVHIEQGPVLAKEAIELGVVTGVQGISWQELTIVGKSAHAGTTPMELRQDAALGLAKIRILLDDMVRSGRYGKDARATIGRIDPSPNLVNIVPGKIVTTIDLRNPDDALMSKAESDFSRGVSEIGDALGLKIEARQTAKTPHIAFSEEIQDLLSAKMSARGLTFRKILSGAGHDAQELAAICPTAMIFVPGEYDGISHNPREYSSPQACARGVQILLDAVLELTRE